MNNKDWGIKLNQKVPAESKILLSGDENHLQIVLRKSALADGNMHNNDSAFEAWALAIMAFCGIKKVKIECDVPDQAARDENRHYQRALSLLQRPVLRAPALMRGRALAGTSMKSPV